ncbi:MAG: type II toxin-antitoxin system VapC family toxin [Phycisphaerales bacterium]|nr:type II toxin-antitoxin system VapC family toxin [Phycisphaerales bacterium]
MILVDTSVWIHHFRSHDRQLATLLNDDQVVVHPMVIGELACGNLPKRKQILALFHELKQAPILSDHEVLSFIEQNALMGKGLGWIDVHLIGSSLRMGAGLWTKDKQLHQICVHFGIA